MHLTKTTPLGLWYGDAVSAEHATAPLAGPREWGADWFVEIIRTPEFEQAEAILWFVRTKNGAWEKIVWFHDQPAEGDPHATGKYIRIDPRDGDIHGILAEFSFYGYDIEIGTTEWPEGYD